MNTLETLVGGHPFLTGMSPQQLKILAESAMKTEFAAGEVIFREGEPANRFYLLLEGRVVLESKAQDREAVPVQTVGAGDVLGWSWLFPPYYWHFDARAVEPTKAIFFYGTRLREQCEENHDLGFDLMKRFAQVLIKRLQSTRKQCLARESKTGLAAIVAAT